MVKVREKKPPKFHRDILAHMAENGGVFAPGPTSPLCLKCNLDKCGAQSPRLQAWGSDDPLITVVFDSVSRKEDVAGQMVAPSSSNALVVDQMNRWAGELGFDMSRVRYVATTKCANRDSAEKINYKTKGNWCRAFAVDDLRRHPPKLVMPVGTTALGLLSHKSNAQDWAGRLLTWRGYPDDWLTHNFKDGHPAIPLPTLEDRRPMMPVLAPRLVYMTQNQLEIRRWSKQVRTAMMCAMNGVAPTNYDRPWFRLLTDPAEVAQALDAIPAGIDVSYDLETTGLFPFDKEAAAIVFAMFRYDLPDGTKIAFGFPWNYPESPLVNHLADLTPRLLAALYRSRIKGHNISFDVVYTYAVLPGADIVKLTASVIADTRHMLYCLRQTKQSLGLELLAYDWAPDMAGYEEEMVMLIDAMPDLLDPSTGPTAHYARCPIDKWETHLKPYVMGDVEVVQIAHQNLKAKLASAKRYEIPLADPNKLGTFRKFAVPSREFVYENFMLPASRTLMRIQARGMYVDQLELKIQEDLFPKLIREAKEKLRNIDERVLAWCQQQEATVPDWRLDLENRDHLKTILFEILSMPVKRLTKAGIKKFGEDIEGVSPEHLLEFAAIDKFTVNNLVAENPRLSPLQDYRKLHKAYTTYVRSMRNITTEGIDKKDRTKHQYLMSDGCVHATFNQCGTRSGRLSSNSPNLQQLPRDSIVKKFYASRFGKDGLIYQADLSQIELRLLAAACGDPTMVGAYRNGIDLHSLTTSRVFNVPYEHFEKTYMAWLQSNGREKEAKELNRKRSIGKTTNFLTGYGGGAFGLQNSLAEEGVYLPLEECERIVEALFDTYPSLRRHIGLYKRFILDHGCAVSITGRVRAFDEVNSDDNSLVSKALRSGFNHLIQPTASDMMLCCMTVIENLMRQANLESVLVSTVHDSLVVDALRKELPQVHEICDAVVNNIPEVMALVLGPDYDTSWLNVVPFAGDSEVGKNYYSAVKISPDKVTLNVDWDRLYETIDHAA